MPEFVKVICNVPNGLVIHTSEEATPDGANGEKRFVNKDMVELRPGSNDVDKAFFKEWLATNSGSDVVGNHLIEFNKGDFEHE